MDYIFRSGQYPYFRLFCLANTHISVCSEWPIPLFRSVWSGQYPYFGLFGLANTHISVWQIPLFQSVSSGQCPYFGLFGLANTHFSVCLVWPIPSFWSVPPGQYAFFDLFSLELKSLFLAVLPENDLRLIEKTNIWDFPICSGCFPPPFSSGLGTGYGGFTNKQL